MIGKQLKVLREKTSKSQQEVCAELNIEQSTLANYENDRRDPKLNILSKIADYFQCSTDYLLGREEADMPFEDGDVEWRYLPASNRFGTILLKYRQSHGLSEKDFAAALNIDVETYVGIEIGKYVPSMDLLKKLSDVTGYDMDYLTGAADHTVIPLGTDAPRSLNSFEANYHFRSRFENLCYRGGITVDNVKDRLDLTLQEFNDIRFNRMPTLSELLRIAYGCNVSLDYLVGKTDISMSPEERRFLAAYVQLNQDNKDIIMGDMKKYIKEQRYEDSVAAEPAPLKEAK